MQSATVVHILSVLEYKRTVLLDFLIDITVEEMFFYPINTLFLFAYLSFVRALF